MPITKVTSGIIKDEAVTQQKIDSSYSGAALSGLRNKIIGGNFDINPWQRGTGFVGLGSGNYCADRFIFEKFTAGEVDVFKSVDAPSIDKAGIFSQHCLHLDITSGDPSMASSEFATISQRIEGYNVSELGFGQAGTRNITLSFWHKHTKTGTYCVSFQNAAQDRSYIAEYTQAAIDEWERAEITLPVDTTGTWDYTNGIGLRVNFTLASGFSFQAAGGSWQSGNYYSTSAQTNSFTTTSNNFRIALVQLEAGTEATPIETRSIDQELMLCQRYYERKYFSASGYAQGSTFQVGSTASWTPKRTSPTASDLGWRSSGTNNYTGTYYGNMTIFSAGEGLFQAQAAATGHTEVLGAHYELRAEL